MLMLDRLLMLLEGAYDFIWDLIEETALMVTLYIWSAYQWHRRTRL